MIQLAPIQELETCSTPGHDNH